MTALNVVVLLLIGVAAVSAFYFLSRGLQARVAQSQQPYGVAKQETRQQMQVNFLRAGFLLIVALILLGIYGLVPSEGTTEDTTTPALTEPEPITVTATAVEAIEATATNEPATPTAEATEMLATSTVTPTSTPTATEAPSVNTAVVNSPNGLWLREAPGGTQEVELIAHETELELLPGRETVDELEWQQVRTPAGNEGWVAADFLIFP